MTVALLMYLNAILVGVDKGGVPGIGLGALALLLAESDSPSMSRRMLGLLVPSFIAGDIYSAFFLYQESIRWEIVRELVLPIAVGMFFSYLSLGMGDADLIRWWAALLILAVSVIALGSGLLNQARGSDKDDDALPTTVGTASQNNTPIRSENKQFSQLSPSTSSSNMKGVNGNGTGKLSSLLKSFFASGACRAGVGFIAGFATVAGSIAAPIVVMYLIGLNLPQQSFNGTKACLLLVCNACKLPGSILLGTLNVNFSDAILVTPLILATIMSAWGVHAFIVPRFTQRAFELFTLGILLVGSLIIIM